MAFKKKPYRVIICGANRDKKVYIPRPPTYATHVYLQIGNRKAIVPIVDFDVLWDSSGWFHYLRMDKNRKVLETYEDKWYWNGRNVEGIEELIKKDT
jgi:hypothetical protein